MLSFLIALCAAGELGRSVKECESVKARQKSWFVSRGVRVVRSCSDLYKSIVGLVVRRGMEFGSIRGRVVAVR